MQWYFINCKTLLLLMGQISKKAEALMGCCHQRGGLEAESLKVGQTLEKP